MEHFLRARDWARWELGIPDDDPRAIRIATQLARSLRMARHFLSAEATLQEVIEAACDEPNLLAEVLAETGRLSHAQGKTEQANQAFHLALSHALGCGDSDLLVSVYLELAELLVEENRPEQALEELTEGVLLATKGDGETATDGPVDLWRLLLRTAELRSQQGECAVARDLISRALFHARREGSLEGQAHSHLLVGRMAVEQGQSEPGRGSLNMARTLFRRLGDRKNTAECLLLQATSLQTTNQPGKIAQRAALLSQAIALSEQAGWEEGIERARLIEDVRC